MTGNIQQPQQNVNSMITLQAAQHIQFNGAVMMSEMKNVATHWCSAICRVSGGLLVGSKVTLSDWSQGALGETGGCNKSVSATMYIFETINYHCYLGQAGEAHGLGPRQPGCTGQGSTPLA